MWGAKPSRTAQRVAMRRAAHQLLDEPRVFDDPLAVAMAGSPSSRPMPMQPVSRALRAFLAVRSRYAEDQLARLSNAAFGNTWCWARDSTRSLTAILFDPPGCTSSKWIIPRRRNGSARNCHAAGIAIPEEMTFAAVDFEPQSLDEGLQRQVSTTAAAFFSWLGVTPYLSRAAFDATIQFIAGMPSGSGVAFDFAVERALLNPRQQRALDALVGASGSRGRTLSAVLRSATRSRAISRAWDLMTIEDLNGEQINARYFAGRSDGLAVSGGGHLLSAWV